ncbi:alcohol dehydrogenase class IV [Anaeroplasma bactoclasticum]|uniref:Alcohol dehydrogenase class IV n=1 Tax=Anaeroplasma bactoclasticum TaxID=2088 RepID=A0A397QW60_9MOLU|nr:iron-containing alcohol dehydrogenase [Anaeroplasma bactoclasticum]RIA64105.1 alcohol dehydrogenase class IV [Anaeroplasma bactoclasticum]
MNIFSLVYNRVFQGVIKVLQKMIHFSIPKVYESIDEIPYILKERGFKKPIIVVSNSVSKSERFIQFNENLKNHDIAGCVYTGVSSDPTIKSIDVLAGFYRAQGCDSIIAIGGGSVIDASKAMGILIKYPKKSLKSFKGVLKVHKNLPFFIAVPTTAGTGSEATIASVVTDSERNDKYAISDGHLVPDIAILDDTLLTFLPSHIIAQTGMDAYTHALEAFIGRNGNKFTNDNALMALKLIKKNLYDFYLDNGNAKARKNMLYASYYAGLAFTRAYVGYVHSLAHAVGGMYHKPHGYTIAILLPYVLEAYGNKAYKKLSIVSDTLGISDSSTSEEEKAKALILWIRNLNKDLGIPNDFNGLIKDKDLEALSLHAAKEANPWYPVPKELTKKELKMILVKANKNNLE